MEGFEKTPRRCKLRVSQNKSILYIKPWKLPERLRNVMNCYSLAILLKMKDLMFTSDCLSSLLIWRQKLKEAVCLKSGNNLFFSNVLF